MPLLLLFILVPMVDLYVLLLVADWLGGMETVALVIVTGVIGASLARHQGISVLTAVQTDMHEGRLPTDHLLSGLLVLVGAVLLLTPGILTDVVGFLLMVPGNRRLVIRLLKGALSSRIHVQTAFPFPGHTAGTPSSIKEAEGVEVLKEGEHASATD